MVGSTPGFYRVPRIASTTGYIINYVNKTFDVVNMRLNMQPVVEASSEWRCLRFNATTSTILKSQFLPSWMCVRRTVKIPKRCVKLASWGQSESINGASQFCHRGQSLSADVRHCTDAHVGHGTVKSDAHQTSDSPSPGVIGGSLQMTAVL